MKGVSKPEEWAALVAVMLLAVLCVLGAFLGAERAAALFNSPPAVFFWVASAALLMSRLVRRAEWVGMPGAFVGCLGVLLILLGGFCGSDVAQRLAGRVFGSRKFAAGFVVLSPGEQTARLADLALERELGLLPFELRLDAFHLTYHEPSQEEVAGRDAEARTRRVKNYEAHVAILQGGREVRQDALGVNRPVHYGGYHFYLHGYTGSEPYVLLLVKSDSGLALVYAGLGLLCVGAFWACWAEPAWAFVRERRRSNGD